MVPARKRAWVADSLERTGGTELPARNPAHLRAAALDRLAPFRQQAREELAGERRDAVTWVKALEQTAGDPNRAVAAYVELRAQALQRAEMDRRWAAHAQAGPALPVRRIP